MNTPRRGGDIPGNVVRALGLELGFVDVKVAAIDEVWSGLKFVRRLVDRPALSKPSSPSWSRSYDCANCWVSSVRNVVQIVCEM